MSESHEDAGTVAQPESVNWTQALTETFKAAQSSPETPSEPVAAEQGESKVEESVPDALQPLEKWPENVRTRFGSFDRETQQFLLDREKDVESHLTKVTQEASETRKRYARFDDVLKPYEDLAKRSGVDLAPVVSQALNYYAAYNRDPLGTLKALAQAARVSPEQLFGVQDPNVDPAIGALRAELDQTRTELANLKQGQIHQEDSRLSEQIQAFKDAKDEQGAAKHPYFDEVRELMAPLVAKGMSLEGAYKKVVRTVDEHFEASVKERMAAAEKEAKKEADKARMEKVRNAKKAETLPSSDTDKGAGKKTLSEVGGWQGALRETINQLQR